MNNVELTSMCAILNEGRVLMINREISWKGWAFPGGHLEPNESMAECVIREMKEETGLEVREIRYKGIAHFYNNMTGARHIIHNYLCSNYSGTVKEKCEEGKLSWIEISKIRELNLAEGMQYRIPLFFEEGIQEMFVEWNENAGYINVKYRKL